MFLHTGFLILCFGLERLVPIKKKSVDKDRLCFHLLLFLFNSSLFTMVCFPIQFSLFSFVEQNKIGLLPKVLPEGWSAGILSFLLLDLSGYLIHRLNHIVPQFWKFHLVHHADNELDFTTGFREHPLQMLTTGCFQILLMLFFGISLKIFTIYNIILFVFTHFHHANIKISDSIEKRLSCFWVTPRTHAFHHSDNKDFYNSNFGSIFSFWDRWFGTYSRSVGCEETLKIGLGHSCSLSLSAVGLLPIVLCLLICGCNQKPRQAFSKEFLTEANYGRELIQHTSRFLGPKGTVAQLTKTRMNCQNCHLAAGEKPYGISFRNTFTKYPEYRAREGVVISLEDRINNCFERPMNGAPLPPKSREMRALLSYFRLLSKGRVVGDELQGDSINELVKFPNRAADPKKGRALYLAKCSNCHGESGEGRLSQDNVEFLYPPLWGEESFNEASNMHRNIKMAAFILGNMPLGATGDKPVLTVEEAFDLAAFINDSSIHSRPKSKWVDYKKVNEKPIDFPEGPYLDSFSQQQHQLGPYLPILQELKNKKWPAYF